jgi:DNA-directed RNA polymerase sigma subunit (sigma70/sigma32)
MRQVNYPGDPPITAAFRWYVAEQWRRGRPQREPLLQTQNKVVQGTPAIMGCRSNAGTSLWLDVAIREQLKRSNLTVARECQLLCLCRSAPNGRSRQAALTELWESHSKLVVAVACRYRQSTIELADLIGAGHLGLHAAIERFDTGRFDGRLASYAIGWIRWHIQDYIRRNVAAVRLPSTTAHRQLAEELPSRTRRGDRDGTLRPYRPAHRSGR